MNGHCFVCRHWRHVRGESAEIEDCRKGIIMRVMLEQGTPELQREPGSVFTTICTEERPRQTGHKRFRKPKKHQEVMPI